jgi:hypothetical protein
MPSRKFFYIKDMLNDRYHRGTTHGGNWGPTPQFFSRRRDAQYRLSELQARVKKYPKGLYRKLTDKPMESAYIVILETNIEWI